MNNIDETMKDIFEQFENNETSYGEPQAWLDASRNRSIEVVKEMEGLDESEYYYSVKVQCSEEEFDNNDFHSTCGVIDALCTDKLDQEELKDLVIKAFEISKIK